MTEKNTKKSGSASVEIIEDETVSRSEVAQILSEQPEKQGGMRLEDYVGIIEALRKVKTFRTTAPTSTPKTFLDAIEFYDSGGVRRVYFYINKTWRYVTLT